MAATIRKVPDTADVTQKSRTQMIEITGDTSYPSGGYPISGPNAGMSRIDGMFTIGSSAAGYKAVYDYVNKKVLFYSNGSQVANTTNISSITIRMKVLGR